MEPVLLTIAIPTRNRSGYLREILQSLIDQILALDPSLRDQVQLHVSDNTSTDDTPAVIQAAGARFNGFTCFRQEQNLGASRNVNACVRAAKGRFTWVIGDDELISPGAVSHVLQLLSAPQPPDLLVCFDTNYEALLPRPARFASYRDYALTCGRINPHALIEHTLVSCNVFRTPLFDQSTAEATLATDYSHMYAVLTSLAREGGSVHLTDTPVITVRRSRAPAVDGVWPTNLEASWLEYLNWQKNLFQIDTLAPEAAIDHVRRQLMRKLTRHPWRYVLDNAKALRDPKAVFWFLKRLLFHSRNRR